MTCTIVDERDLIEQHLLGRLRGAEREAFEQHLFECERCVRRLEAVYALRDELARQRAEILSRPSAAKFSARSKVAALAAGLVLAAALGVWRLRPVAGPSSTAQAMPPPAAAIAEAPSADKNPSPPETAPPELVALARVEPPPYIPFRVRGAGETTSADFDAAMLDYADGHYADAARRLRLARKDHPDDIPANFFLGVSLLMIDEVDAASEALRHTIQLGDSPFQQVASLDLAKALIRRGDLAGARRELSRTPSYRGGHAAEAKSLGRQLQARVDSR